jgi:hypothetical protein
VTDVLSIGFSTAHQFFLVSSPIGSDAKAPLLPELLQQAAPLPPPPDFNQMAAASGSASQAGGSAMGKTGEKKIPK